MKDFNVVTLPPSGKSGQKKIQNIPKRILLDTFESNIGGQFVNNKPNVKAKFLEY